MPATKQSRFMELVEKLDYGCWHIDVNCHTNSGYPVFLGKLAHRQSYEMFNGELIKGLVIDHICNDKLCVNPSHLQQISYKENTLRGSSPIAINAVKTHCNKGHELSGANLYIKPNGSRNCKMCRKHAAQRYSLRRSVYA